ncbi:MAG TPA: beta-ketoacyl synthase N-terminal-like domain-containing protein, partial [Thermoanaerobaculia bacterium]|nr:beta-ketoacyl synthase N-terminal-like domain-containing protein [Thermoanaerobaculia bacterium]
MTRIVVTGLGLVTPVGMGREEVWEALLAGRSGIRPVQSFDTSRFTARLGAEVPGFRPALKTLDPAKTGRASQFAATAARMALEDAGLGSGDVAPERGGVAMGTTSGEPLEVERFDDRY